MIKTDDIPGTRWVSHDDPAAAGFDAAALDRLKARLSGLTTTSFMVVSGGRVAFEMGDVSEASYLASTRKSILSMLYGPHVEAGAIDLDLTLEQLGIDDVKGLTPAERQARLRDLLTSRSGVYYPAGSPGGDDNNPPRGSKAPGTYFQYNNWDFNVAGRVFADLTGIAVHDALEAQLARPLQFEDFDRSRQRMVGYPDRSRHLAYHMFLSCRDMARIGLLAVRRGLWGPTRLIGEAWMRESTSAHVTVADMPGSRKANGLGYGYYWWIPERPGPEWAGAFLAAGHFGQFILGFPAIDLVVVHRRAITDEQAIARNTGMDKSDLPSVSSATMLELGQDVLSARRAR